MKKMEPPSHPSFILVTNPQNSPGSLSEVYRFCFSSAEDRPFFPRCQGSAEGIQTTTGSRGYRVAK